MRWNVVEVANNGHYAKLFRGFLLIMRGDKELGRVIIDEMACLLISAEQAILSKPVMVKLAEHGVPVVLCDKSYHPASITLPYNNHYQMTKVMKAQISASKPVNKRLWQSLVSTKISHQYNTLKHIHPHHKSLSVIQRMATNVRSGDPNNIEAQAARVYWRALFGSDFRRRTDDKLGINSALNYGYSILRAACARSLVGAGLLPALGIFHSHAGNPFCLADDLLEVYRPVVDRFVSEVGPSSQQTLTSEHKAVLVKLLQYDVEVERKKVTLLSSIQSLAASLTRVYLNEKKCLTMPHIEPT